MYLFPFDMVRQGSRIICAETGGVNADRMMRGKGYIRYYFSGGNTIYVRDSVMSRIIGSDPG